MKNFWRAFKAVFSAFAGIRAAAAADLPALRARHYIAAGVAALIIFVLLLVAAVNAIA
ncbi:MAG: DUF2970 domain-containing protein [Betaproteobacteria bacterium]|nr:DUF2970 domain-containing protein [Betaproteobacteria bacterium]